MDFPCFFPPEPGLFRCPGASVAGPKGQGMWQVRWIDLEVGGALLVAFLLVEVCNFGAMKKFQIVRTCKLMEHLKKITKLRIIYQIQYIDPPKIGLAV